MPGQLPPVNREPNEPIPVDELLLYPPPAFLQTYGALGLETVRRMHDVLGENASSLIYNHRAQNFIMGQTAQRSHDEIRAIFAQGHYSGYEPTVQRTRTFNRSIVVVLTPIILRVHRVLPLRSHPR